MTTTRPGQPPPNFGQLVDTYQAEILRYLRRLTGDPATADGLFQDTFLRAFKAFSRLRAQTHHRAWLYRIATNRFLNHRRSRAAAWKIRWLVMCGAEQRRPSRLMSAR